MNIVLPTFPYTIKIYMHVQITHWEIMEADAKDYDEVSEPQIEEGAEFVRELNLSKGDKGYVHTITFSHRFLLFGSKLELPWDCGTIENDAKTLPCARSQSA